LADERLTPELRIVLILLVLGAALRLAFLGSNPPGLFRDEAEKVYTAWSLGRTGGYHHLVALRGPGGGSVPAFEWVGPPFIVDAYGSHISALYHWLDVPFALALGPTRWGARLPAALVGFLTLLVVWRYVRRAFDAEVAVLAVFFLAISPWHVLFSRWAQQGIFVPLWLALALWLFERGRLGAGRPWWLAGVALGLAFYSYAPARLAVPLFLAALAWAHRQDIVRNRRAALVALLAFLITVLPTALWLSLHHGEGFARWSHVSIFGMPGASPLTVLTQFIANYLRHLSVPFLFLWGDANPRHSIPGFGQMHWIELPGLLAALLIALLQRRPQDRTLALWFLLAPVAPSLTLESPHALRDIMALPAAHILSAAGTAAIFRGLVRWAHAALPRRLPLRNLQAWVRTNIDPIRMTGLLAGGVTAFLFTLQLFIRYPALSAAHWDTEVGAALRATDVYVRAGHPAFVTSGSPGSELLYLPTHLRVALRTDPASLGRVAPYLPRGWNQCGSGPTSPEAVWEMTGGDSGHGVFLTAPTELPGEPFETFWSPSNRFTPAPRILWEIHVQGETTSPEARQLHSAFP
jgi:hypothetical protein